jgi:hypothetical protein
MPLASIADLNSPDAPEMIEIAKRLSYMYDDFLDNFPSDKHQREAGIHASEICTCVRKVFYNLTKVETKDKTSKHWRKRFEIGHAIHEMTQRHFHRMALVENAKRYAENLAYVNGWSLDFKDEVRVHPSLQPLAHYYKFYSSCDGIFTFRLTPDHPPFLRVGLEIKSESPKQYEDLKTPKGYHIDQAHIYMAALDLPLIWFYYFNKGNQNTTPSEAPWLVTFNPAIWQKLEARSRVALEAEKTGVEPVREEGMHCEFCPWSWKCEPAYLNRATAPRSYGNTLRRSGV